MSELIREWDKHVIEGNRISRDLESFDGVMKIAELPESKVALYVNGGTTYIDTVLPEEVMGVLKTIVTNQLVDIRSRKETELKKHMNSWKPATINPEFEAAVQGMEQQGNAKQDPLEEKLAEILLKEDESLEKPVEESSPLSVTIYEILEQDKEKIRKLYEDDSITVGEIAAKYGVDKKIIYGFASRNHFTRIKKPSGFLDSDPKPRRERP
jgi:hypothetical protein